jgi:hypothetical protein
MEDATRLRNHVRPTSTLINASSIAGVHSSNKASHKFSALRNIALHILGEGVGLDPWPRHRCEGDPNATGITIKIFPHTFVALSNKDVDFCE